MLQGGAACHWGKHLLPAAATPRPARLYKPMARRWGKAALIAEPRGMTQNKNPRDLSWPRKSQKVPEEGNNKGSL